MEYRRLGRFGLKVAPLVLGTMNFGGVTDKKESIKIINEPLDAGINLFDCADVYSGGESERVLGDALKEGGKRKSAFITSKTFMPSGSGPNDRGSSKHHILESVETSLRSLKTDYIDIYFLHRSDFSIPLEEPLAALNVLVNQGKVRYVASSTHPSWTDGSRWRFCRCAGKHHRSPDNRAVSRSSAERGNRAYRRGSGVL